MSANVPPVLPGNSSTATRSNAGNARAGNTPASTAGQNQQAHTNATSTLNQQSAAQALRQNQAPQSQAQQRPVQPPPQSQQPPQLAGQLQAGQTVQVRVLPPAPNQPAGQVLLQTPNGQVAVNGQNLPPPQTTAFLSLLGNPSAQAAALQNATTGTSTQQLWQLVWQATTGNIQKAGQAKGQPHSIGTPISTSTLQGQLVTATTLSPKSVSHLLTQPSPTQQGQTQLQASPANKVTAVSLLGNADKGPYPPNHSVSLRIVQVQPPGQASAATMTLGTAAQTAASLQNGFSPFQAVVIGSQPGQVIVQSALGPMSFAIPQSLPTGSILTLLPLSEASLNPASLSGYSASAMQERWAGLKDVMAMIQAGNPMAAQQIMNSLPQPNAQLPTAMLFLLSTMRGGALENWVGKAAAGRISGPLGERLTEVLRQSTRQTRDANGQDWRVFGMPVAQDGDFGDLWLYLKDHNESEETDSDSEEKGKRFIIETNFQKMGPLQLDGLATDKTIDLMFRSLIPVEDGLRDEIRGLFANVVSALGLTGTIRFHVSKNFPVSIAEENANLGGSVTI